MTVEQKKSPVGLTVREEPLRCQPWRPRRTGVS